MWPYLPIGFGDVMSYLQITEFKVLRNERLFEVFPKSKKGIKTPSASKLAKATGILMMVFRFSSRTPSTLTDVLVVFRVRPDKCRTYTLSNHFNSLLTNRPIFRR